jgi:RecA-family ATPase
MDNRDSRIKRIVDELGRSVEPAPPPPPLKVYSACDLARIEAPEREWGVPGVFPIGCVGLLSGNGGEGKSLLLQQLGFAHATGTDWIGKLPRQGKALILSCEDGKNECHRRIRDIVAGREDINLEDLDNFEIVDLAGEDAIMAILDKTGMKTTPFFEQIEAKVRDFRPLMLGLDTLADLYGGDENIRGQVRQFIGFLTRLAIKYPPMYVVLLAHPSLSGMANGTGLSGSTGWHNTVRARSYLKPQATADGDEPDPTRKQLEIMKSNYGPAGEIIKIQWKAGRFGLQGTVPPIEKIAADRKCDEAFMRLFKLHTDINYELSPRVSNAYAPKIFADREDSGGVTSKQFAKAMNRLAERGEIRFVEVGPQSKRKWCIKLG